MTTTPEEPAGIGTPATGQPGFVPPDSAEAAWTAPDPAARVDSTTPIGRPPQRPRRTRRALVAAVLVGGLLLIGLLSALPVVPPVTPTSGASAATAAAATPVVVTVSPSVVPTAASTVTTGGSITEAVEFSSTEGTGTLTITRAVWTDVGEAAPVEGQRYLVVDLTVACRKGVVPVDPILFTASTGSSTSLAGFGPALTRPLGGRLLAAGEEVSGQVGFALAPGAVEVTLRDEDLRVLATAQVPAP